MEEFFEQVKSLSKRAQKLKSSPMTEEATKTSIIMPFFQILGYDIFNPEEFLPEFTADVGIKKGEKVDYAILKDGNPLILIEAKAINEKLEKYDSQLYRYFGTTPAKFSILTNGLDYRFYTDLDELNKMDSKPFFIFNLLDIRDNQLTELAKFKKSNFDVDHILNTASELKYTGEIKQFLINQWEKPTDNFVSFVISDIYPGKKTKNVLDKFNLLVKKSFKEVINDQVNDKLKAALEGYNNNDDESDAKEPLQAVSEVAATTAVIENEEPQIVTTEEELEGYVLVKILLRETLTNDRLFYRDNLSYFNILVDDNIRKWIVRLGFNTSNKYIQLNDENRTVYHINNVSEIENYKNEIITVTKKFL